MNNTAQLLNIDKTIKELILTNYSDDYKECRTAVFSLIIPIYELNMKDGYTSNSINKKFLLIYLQISSRPRLTLIKS